MKTDFRDFLTVQQLGLYILTADGPDSIPGQGTEIPQAVHHCQKKKVLNGK